MEAEAIFRIVLSLVLVCAIAAAFIIFVLPKYYKAEQQQIQPFKVSSKIRLDLDSHIIILENKEFPRLVLLSGKQGSSFIGTLDKEDKFISKV